MCAQLLQAEFREYVSSDGEESVSLVRRQGPEGEDDLARAWFPQGIKTRETAVSPLEATSGVIHSPVSHCQLA